MMRRLMLILPLIAALLAACSGGKPGGNVAFSAFSPIDGDGWRYCDTLTFVVGAPADTVPTAGNIALCVRHNDAYPYSNIWVELIMPRGKYPLQMELADVYGRWHGRGMGLTFECTDTLLRGAVLQRGDTVRLRHNMRVDTLPAVEQVGIFFIKS